MEAIASQIRDLYANSDDEGRRKIQDGLRELQFSFDSEWDMAVRLGSGPLQMALVRIGTDLKLYDMLVASETPLSLEHIRAKTGAASALLGHVLRAEAAFGFIKETAQDEFTANRTTRILSNEHIAGAIEHSNDVHAPTAQVLPTFLKERNYQNITSSKDLPFHKALKTDLAPFDWMKQQPGQMKNLAHAMAIERKDFWADVYPVEKEVGSFSPPPESALLVDVGGSLGHQAIAFKNKFSSLPGRIIVQDIPETLDLATAVDGIEFLVQDFFKPQAIKGAKFYYLRNILHDWNDADSIKILKAIIPAMGPDSRIVIDEVVLPDTNVPRVAAFVNLTMMSLLGGSERTKADFEKLLDQAGLKITSISKYDPKMQSVIFAVPK